MTGKPLSGKLKENWSDAAANYQKLYRYCMDLMQVRHERKSLEEDINTLKELKKYRVTAD